MSSFSSGQEFFWGRVAAEPESVLLVGPDSGEEFDDRANWWDFADSGDIALVNRAVMPTKTGSFEIDSLWLNSDRLYLGNEDVPSLPGFIWFGFIHVGITAVGTPYWTGFIFNEGDSVIERAYFLGAGATPVLRVGDEVPGLGVIESLGQFSGRSRNGVHTIASVEIRQGDGLGGSESLLAILIDGAVATAGGVPLIEGNPIPESVGGLPGETFHFGSSIPRINDAGQWAFSAGTEIGYDSQSIILQDGVVVFRGNTTVDGQPLGFSGRLQDLNEQGDLLVSWDFAGLEPLGGDGDPMLFGGLFLNGQLLYGPDDPVDIDGDLVPDIGAQLISYDRGELSSRRPDGSIDVYARGVSYVPTLGFPKGAISGVYRQTLAPAECFLVIGPGPGQTTFDPGLHPFEPQVSEVTSHQEVLLENLGEVPLSEFLPATLPGGAQRIEDFGAKRLVATFSAQVLMYNPRVFPLNPEQYTQPIQVGVFSDGSVASRPYGTGTGMEVWVETAVSAAGERVVRFPFSIPGF